MGTFYVHSHYPWCVVVPLFHPLWLWLRIRVVLNCVFAGNCIVRILRRVESAVKRESMRIMVIKWSRDMLMSSVSLLTG